ncbi:tRNA lysidine(34) synthetase TilS [Alteromonas sp. KUL49]|uniref:tRNA lysidine(34) synthetase TilS n=1 Tax=Alteromonas sp. KUL49 TaxID=2480798 RepID=UPI00102F1BDA|nr:tRNA lysidine(34) synthetase TilS [Alteromonas sp. KUL49]TAP39635.1 tRNA lysidine(34) synthetase TilS [Alteromonas sp. KUL49]GEA11614.1 tRNA(Ile)-lysidine synthase [Alteromonas sp. KUL49]
MHETFASIHQAIDNVLTDLPSTTPRTLVVGYSGGVDSSVLLDALCRYQKIPSNNDIEIHAVYVNHGLSSNADEWQAHCERVCRQYGILFTAIPVTVDTGNRKSLESEARDARYKALLTYCKANHGVLVLGQHGEDQLETFLLQLKRGAGPKGLSSMAPLQCKEGVFTLRPMLNIAKADILEGARYAKLFWVEDESNQNDDFDRNFLRNRILPLLTQRWPQLSKTVGRSAALCAQQNTLIVEEALNKLAHVSNGNYVLSGEALRAYSSAWQAEVIRVWFEVHKQQPPSSKQLEEIMGFLVLRDDATPHIDFTWGSIRRHDGDLYWVVKDSLKAPEKLSISPNKPEHLAWFNLSVVIKTTSLSEDFKLVTNVHGLVVKPMNASVSKPINRWFKAWKVPVWLRRTTPVFYCGEQAIGTLVDNKPIMFSDCPEGIELLVEAQPHEKGQ